MLMTELEKHIQGMHKSAENLEDIAEMASAAKWVSIGLAVATAVDGIQSYFTGYSVIRDAGEPLFHEPFQSFPYLNSAVACGVVSLLALCLSGIERFAYSQSMNAKCSALFFDGINKVIADEESEQPKTSLI